MSDASPLLSDRENARSPSTRNGQVAVAHPGTPRLTSERLLGGQRMLEIVHGTEAYHLRLTAAGKLILAK